MKKILIIYTGGTIGMIKDYKTGTLKPFNFENILKKIPELKLLEVELHSFSFEKPIDSSDMNIVHWQEIAEVLQKNYQLYDGFVILHGTDTMSYTASALSFMIDGLQKPILFTGSQLPIGDLRTDSKENIITSIYYATLHQNKQPLLREVCIYFEYKLFRANRATKYSTAHFDAYVSPNFPLLGEAGVQLQISEELLYNYENKQFSIQTSLQNQVEIFKYFPSCSYKMLRKMVEDESIKVIILETFGSGNIPMDEENLALLRQSKKLGKIIIVTSQCVVGNIHLGKYRNSAIFVEIEAIDGKDMTQETLVTKAMFLLGQDLDNQQFKKAFEQNLRGEC